MEVRDAAPSMRTSECLSGDAAGSKTVDQHAETCLSDSFVLRVMPAAPSGVGTKILAEVL